MDYKLKIILSICPSAFEASEEFYKNRMANFKKEYDDKFLAEFNIEFNHLLKNNSYSFKKCCEESDFFAFDLEENESKTRKYLVNFLTTTGFLK